MPSPRTVLAQLTRDELLAAVARFDLSVADRRVRDHLVEAIASSKKATLGQLLVTVPSLACQKAFDALVTPMRHKQLSNEEESQTLAALRDLLLPKLISGELRIRDAETLVAAAT